MIAIVSNSVGDLTWEMGDICPLSQWASYCSFFSRLTSPPLQETSQSIHGHFWSKSCKHFRAAQELQEMPLSEQLSVWSIAKWIYRESLVLLCISSALRFVWIVMKPYVVSSVYGTLRQSRYHVALWSDRGRLRHSDVLDLTYRSSTMNWCCRLIGDISDHN